MTVAVAGAADAGQSARLTLKVSRSDLAKRADGKLTTEELRKKVARRGAAETQAAGF